MKYNKLKYRVDLTEVHRLLKNPKRLPVAIREKAMDWAESIELFGLAKVVGEAKGLSDHPLKGKRVGQRAIYLNYKWRLIYEIEASRDQIIIKVKEITPHDY